MMHQFLLYDKAFIMPASILNPSNASWLACSCCHHLLFEKQNQSNMIHIRHTIIHTCPHCDTAFRYIILFTDFHFYIYLGFPIIYQYQLFYISYNCQLFLLEPLLFLLIYQSPVRYNCQTFRYIVLSTDYIYGCCIFT